MNNVTATFSIALCTLFSLIHACQENSSPFSPEAKCDLLTLAPLKIPENDSPGPTIEQRHPRRPHTPKHHAPKHFTFSDEDIQRSEQRSEQRTRRKAEQSEQDVIRQLLQQAQEVERRNRGLQQRNRSLLGNLFERLWQSNDLPMWHMLPPKWRPGRGADAPTPYNSPDIRENQS
jgi:hypothetical protein